MRRAVFVADVHLGEVNASYLAFLDFLDTLKDGTDALFCLGDLFEFWIGREAAMLPFQMPVLAKIDELRHNNLALYYVEGNRDFFLRRRFEGSHFTKVFEHPVDIPLGKDSVHLAHGDLLNPADWRYRLWRTVVKNRMVSGGIDLLPASVVLGLARFVHKKFVEYGLTLRGPLPEKAIRRYVVDRSTTTFLIGHFHTKKVITEGEKTVYCLPAWPEGREYLEYTPSRGFRFQRFDGP